MIVKSCLSALNQQNGSFHSKDSNSRRIKSPLILRTPAQRSYKRGWTNQIHLYCSQLYVCRVNTIFVPFDTSTPEKNNKTKQNPRALFNEGHKMISISAPVSLSYPLTSAPSHHHHKPPSSPTDPPHIHTQTHDEAYSPRFPRRKMVLRLEILFSEVVSDYRFGAWSVGPASERLREAQNINWCSAPKNRSSGWEN